MRTAHILASLVFVPAFLENRAAAVDCDGNGVDDALELARDPGRDCNSNGLLDECDLMAIHRGFFDGGPVSSFTRHSSPVLACDLEPDGDTDLIGSALEPAGLFFLRNDGAGSFELSVREAGTVEILRAAGDLDGDGGIDLVVSRPSPGDVIVLVNDGGSFSEGPVAPVDEILDAAAADLDGDGDDDLVGVVPVGRSSRALAILRSIGGGAFATPESLLASGQPSSPAPADLDSDGLEDLAAVVDGGNVQGFVNDGEGGFRKGTVHPATGVPLASLHPVDLDQDGDDDLIAKSVRELHVLSSDGTAGFAVSSRHFIADGAPGTAAADFDGDGDPDIAGLSRHGPVILVNSGQGALEPAHRAGWNRNAYPGPLAAGDFDLDGAMDLAAPPGPVILWNRRMALSLDCNGNGHPDECDALLGSPSEGSQAPGACRDCNGNGIVDATEIELGLQDGDRNGVPDQCETRRFVLRADAPAAVHGEPGGRVRIPAVVELHGLGFEPGESGATAWVVYLEASNALIEDVTLEGTAAAPRPEGFRNPSASFLRMGFFREDAGPCEGALLAIVALDIEQPVALDPAGSPHTILRLALGAAVPRDGAEFCGLHFVSCDSCRSADPIPGAGGGGCGGEQSSYASTPASILPTSTRDRIVFIVPSGFRRGDVNGSGEVDISDPIRLLMSLFLGAEPPPCMDAADGNDDGLVNISDGIFLLQDLFVGAIGTVIPRPGPFECGLDPTEDALDCADPGGCP